jgi:transposase
VFKPKTLPQPELFVPSVLLVQPATSSFYSKLEQTLASFGFSDQVRQLCASVYSDSGRGRPGVDPVVYFKMLMIGFFENISSERSIAERCSDSISIRFFLGYDLTQSTPDHSTLSVIRDRLGEDTYHKVFLLILGALQEHGLLKGQQVGIDTSVIEANAALKSLVNRNTAEAYWEFVCRLASENGVDPKDSEAVRQFDRKRPKKMSNDDWENPHDPDAKIGPTKAGAIDMIYKPEHAVDLDTGAILQAEVRLGHEADPKELALHVLQAQVNINQAQGRPADSLTIQSATADKGYHAVTELHQLQQEGIRTVISDPIKNRKFEKLSREEARAMRSARRSVRSESGKKLLRKRGMHLERSFAHLLDAGGVRRTTLRGLENLNKRFKLSAAIYNLSQLMRKLWGVGTPKQWAAGVKTLVWILHHLFAAGRSRLADGIARRIAGFEYRWEQSRTRLVGWIKNKTSAFFRSPFLGLRKTHFSTGC